MGPRNSDTRAGFGTDHTMMLCKDILALPRVESFEFWASLENVWPAWPGFQAQWWTQSAPWLVFWKDTVNIHEWDTEAPVCLLCFLFSKSVAQRLLPPASSPPCPLSPIYLSPWRKSSWLCELRLLLVTMEAADGKPKTAGSEGSPLIHSRRAGETLQRAGMSHKISCTPSALFPRLWSSWEEMNTQEKRFFFEFSPGELYQDLSVDGPCLKVVHFKMVQLHDVTYVILKLTGILCSNPFSN